MGRKIRRIKNDDKPGGGQLAHAGFGEGGRAQKRAQRSLNPIQPLFRRRDRHVERAPARRQSGQHHAFDLAFQRRGRIRRPDRAQRERQGDGPQ